MMIREVKPEDAPALAKIQVDSYQIAYKNLLPQSILDTFSYEEQTQDWVEWLADNHDEYMVVVVIGNNPVGYARGRRLDNNTSDYEIAAVHVLKAYQGKGIGKALIHAVAQHCAEQDCKSIMAWTLHNNPVRNLCEKLGATYGEQKTSAWDEQTQVTEVSYHWSDVHHLIAVTQQQT
jgi:GNAT superfamily N-acetyltransferase